MSNDSVFRTSGLQAVIGDDGAERVGLIGGRVYMPPLTAIKSIEGCQLKDLPRLVAGACFADGLSRYLGASSFGAYPFKGVVGLTERDVFKPFLAQQNERATFLLIITAVLGAAGVFAMGMTIALRLRRDEDEEVRSAYRQATDNGREGFYLWRKLEAKDGSILDFRVVDCNERGAEFYGMSKSALMGSTLLDLNGKSPHRDAVVTKFTDMYIQGSGEEDYEIRLASLIKCKWQHRRYLKTFDGLALTTSDITTQIEPQQEMARLVVEDNLTELPNRRWLTQNLPAILERARVTASGAAVLFLDIDDFKDVNDSRGHSIGDALLKAVAERLRQSVRPGDFVVRLGGDEFTLVMQGVGDGAQVEAFAQRVLVAIASPFDIADEQLSISVSVGAAIYPRDGVDAEALLKNADIAMHASKITKGTFTLFSAHLDEAKQTRISTERDIATALKNDEFVLYYQPRFASASGVVVGMEALIRWHHPKPGLVMPNDFIPIAKTSDLIVQTGSVVARKVAIQIQGWQKRGLAVVPISLNVSRRQFNQG